MHELSHQVGLIDLYQLNMNVTSVHVLDRHGMPANFGFTWPRPDLMGGGDIAPHTDDHLYSSHGAAGFSSTKGYRRGYYGEYQYDIPAENFLLVLDNQGNPAAEVTVSLYQRNGPVVWPGDVTIDNAPEFAGTTGADGRVQIANRQIIGGPWATATGHVLRDNPFGVVDVVGGRNRFLVKLARGKHEEFAWLDITDFNLAYWRGDRDSHTFTLASHVPAEAIPAAPEGLTAQVAHRQVTLRWRGSLIPEVRGYYVYRATRPTYAYERISGLVQDADPTYVTECHGGDCVYTVTALDLDDRESGFSDAAWAPDLVLPSAVVIADRGPAPTPVAVTVTVPPSTVGAYPRGRPGGQAQAGPAQGLPLRVILDTHAGPLIRQLPDERYLSRIGSVHVNLTGCRYLAFDPHGEGRFLVSDPKEHGVLVMDAALDSPAFPYWFGEYGTGPNQFRSPAGVAVWDQPCNSDACQRILVADSGNDRIQAFNPYGSFISLYGTTGSGPGQFHDPQGLAVDDLGRVIVVDRGNNRLQLLAFDGQRFSHLKTITGGFNGPTGVWAYGSDRILVADTGNNVVKELIGDGDSYIVKEHREPLSEPRGVAADRDGNLIVADTGNRRIVTLHGALPTFTPLPPVTPTTAPTVTSTPTPSVTPTPTTTIPGSISGIAWHDRDGDGSRDPGEPGLAGVIIRLYRWDTEFAETQTAADGSYRFAPLVPGALYRVREAQPAWLRWSTTPDEVPIALANGQHAVADFGDWNGRPTWLPLILRQTANPMQGGNP